MDATEARKVVVFTGAGVAVPLGLPTTVQFMDAIKEGQLAVTRQISSYLGTGVPKSSRGEDVEWILGELERFSVGTSFIEENLNNFSGGNNTVLSYVPHIQGVIRQWKVDARGEITRIKKIIYRKLISYDSKKTHDLYRALIKQLKRRHPHASFSFITTNYDLTFDEFIEDVDRDDIGVDDFDINFRNGRYNNKDDTFDWQPKIIEYLKIHGSLDWHINTRKCSRSGIATTPDNPDDLPILYPGFKGAPQNEPFVSLHGKLARRLNQAEIVYVIGFAFRDDYINAIFENTMRLRDELAVYHINPSKIDAYPEESLVPKFQKNFSNFHVVQKGIELSDEPLPTP
jgi:hypothetical protein